MSPDRARSLREPSEVTDLAARGPLNASQRGPATAAGIRGAVRPHKYHASSQMRIGSLPFNTTGSPTPSPLDIIRP
jgi:hypothetical protein